MNVKSSRILVHHEQRPHVSLFEIQVRVKYEEPGAGVGNMEPTYLSA